MRGWNVIHIDASDPEIIRVGRLLGSDRTTSSVHSVIHCGNLSVKTRNFWRDLKKKAYSIAIQGVLGLLVEG